MALEPSNPKHSPFTESTAILYTFTSPALTPEEAGPRERRGSPVREVPEGPCGPAVLREFTDPPGGAPLDSPEVLERQRRRRRHPDGEAPGTPPEGDPAEE